MLITVSFMRNPRSLAVSVLLFGSLSCATAPATREKATPAANLQAAAASSLTQHAAVQNNTFDWTRVQYVVAQADSELDHEKVASERKNAQGKTKRKGQVYALKRGPQNEKKDLKTAEIRRGNNIPWSTSRTMITIWDNAAAWFLTRTAGADRSSFIYVNGEAPAVVGDEKNESIRAASEGTRFVVGRFPDGNMVRYLVIPIDTHPANPIEIEIHLGGGNWSRTPIVAGQVFEAEFMKSNQPGQHWVPTGLAEIHTFMETPGFDAPVPPEALKDWETAARRVLYDLNFQREGRAVP